MTKTETFLCHCGQSFQKEIPAFFDLDADSSLLDTILAGDFLVFTCESCKTELRPERRLAFKWKELSLTWLPETERLRFLGRPERYIEEEKIDSDSIVFGYKELAEKIAILRDGLDTFLLELVKLLLMARVPEESFSEDLELYYRGREEEALLFLVTGLLSPDGEHRSAELRFPKELWEELVEEKDEYMADTDYAGMIIGPYCSYRNVIIEDDED